MANNCIICGAEFVDGKCPNIHGIKPMCLNCVSCIYTVQGEYRCDNEKVLDVAAQKMMEALPEGYEVEELEIKPMLLKNPCKKCSNYTMDVMTVGRTVLESVGLGIEDVQLEK